jgi:hypothetical protein
MSDISIVAVSDGSILAPLDAADLRSRGLLGVESSTGKQNIHKRRANRSSEEEYRNVSLNIRPQSPEAVDAYVTIPTVLISRQTLVYMGLNDDKATHIWNRWTNWPVGGPRRETDPDDGGLVVSFEDFVEGQVTGQVQDASGLNDNQWRLCLIACGMANEAQDAIMDRHFNQIRQTESCLFWVRDTMAMRYAGLVDIQRASREREMALQRQASRPSGSGHSAGRGGSTSSAAVSSSSQSRRSASGLQQERTPGIEAEPWTNRSASAMAASNAPGNLHLFKGLDKPRINGLFDERSNVANIGKLISGVAGDFNSRQEAFYLTPDVHVAECYARYAKRRTNCEAVVIVCLTMPNRAIEQLAAPEIQRVWWPTDEWKELVYTCRNHKVLPKHLRKYKTATLVIGTTARQPNSAFQAMNGWEEVSDSFVLRMDSTGQLADIGRPAVQYVFQGNDDEGEEFLMANGGRQLKVFQYPASELQEWLASH